MNWMIRYDHITTSIVNVAFFVGEFANLPEIHMLPSILAASQALTKPLGKV